MIRLKYHLLDYQSVIFNDDDHFYDVLDHENIHDTMLTKWFETNTNNISIINLTFVEFSSK